MEWLASRQHGVVSRAQLRALGVRDDAIDWRVGNGRLHAVHRGVYAVGHTALSREGIFLAAVLACGPGAVLSHRSAAALWGLLDRWWPRVDVTVGRTGRARPAGLAIHRTRRIEAEEVTEHRGIAITTPARTITDLADVVPEADLRRALRHAEFDRLATPGDVLVIPGRRGARRLERALLRGPDRTRSVLERRMVALCRREGLEPPEVNERPIGFEVDFLWRAAKVVAETDGWRAHGTRDAFERDRDRDQRLSRAGFRVVRFTDRQLKDDPAGVARTLRAVLG